MATQQWFLRHTNTSDGRFALLDTSGAGSGEDCGGWVVAKTAATVYSRTPTYKHTVEYTPTWDASQPSEALDPTNRNAARTENPLNGSYAAAAWAFSAFMYAISASGTQDGNIVVRLLKGSAADGSNATQLVAWTLGSNLLNISTTGAASTGSLSPGAVTLSNEYLFLQFCWEITGAGGNVNCDVHIKSNSSSYLTTADYTPSVQTIDVSGTIAASSALSGAPIQEVSTSGTVAAAATLSGAPTQDVVASGTLAAAATLSGDPEHSGSGTTHFADGTVAGQAALSGVPVSSIPVAGSLAASASLSGAPVQVVDVSGAVAAAAGLSGAPVLFIPVSGSLAALAALGGSPEHVAAGAHDVSGTIAASSTLSGAVVLSHALSGLLAAVATVSGDPVNPQTWSVSGILAAMAMLEGEAIVSATYVRSGATLNMRFRPAGIVFKRVST